MQYNNYIESHVRRVIKKFSEQPLITIMEGTGDFSFCVLKKKNEHTLKSASVSVRTADRLFDNF